MHTITHVPVYWQALIRNIDRRTTGSVDNCTKKSTYVVSISNDNEKINSKYNQWMIGSIVTWNQKISEIKYMWYQRVRWYISIKKYSVQHIKQNLNSRTSHSSVNTERTYDKCTQKKHMLMLSLRKLDEIRTK